MKSIIARMTSKRSGETPRYTSNGLPRSLVPALQDYDAALLDLERDAIVVIERALEHGDCDALAWLFKRYGERRVKDVVVARGARHLSARAFRFWQVVLDIVDWQPHPWPAVARATWPYRG